MKVDMILNMKNHMNFVLLYPLAFSDSVVLDTFVRLRAGGGVVGLVAVDGATVLVALVTIFCILLVADIDLATTATGECWVVTATTEEVSSSKKNQISLHTSQV